jgi:hypothetical protein
MIVDVRCYIESTAAHFKSRWGAILAGVYLLPGAWIIVSTYRCRSMFCDLPAIVYSALPVPFLKLFYIAGAVLQGVSWWQAAWPMPGAILAALSLVCNAGTIYFIVLLIGKVFRRKVASQA